MSASKHTPGGSFIEKNCVWCGKSFIAKKADVKRGWAKCCSKSCSASLREKKLNRRGFRSGGSGFFERRFNEAETFSDAHLFSNEEHDCNKD